MTNIQFYPIAGQFRPAARMRHRLRAILPEAHHRQIRLHLVTCEQTKPTA
jgi:hypothetical protein